MIALGVLLCVSLEFLNVKFLFSFLRDWVSDRWWVLFLDYTEKRGEAMYYFSLFMMAVVAGILFIGFAQEVDFTIAFYILGGIFFAFSLYCFACYFGATGFWLGLVLWFALLFLGLFHIVVWGVLGFIPYALFPLALGIPVLFYLWAAAIVDKIGPHKISEDFSKIENSKEYLEALELDRKSAPSDYKRALENFESSKKEHEKYLIVLRRQISEYESAVEDCRKMQSRIEQKIRQNNVLHQNEKNRETVRKLVYFIDHKRADSVKEALNLLAQAQYNEALKKQIDAYISSTQATLASTQAAIRKNQAETEKMIEGIRNRIASSELATQQAMKEAAAKIEKAERETNERLRETIGSKLSDIRTEQEMSRYQAASAIGSIQSDLYHIDRKL